MTEDTRISKDAVEAALIKWFGIDDWPRMFGHVIEHRRRMMEAIATADRVRGRSYFEWRPIESCPKTSKARLVWCPEFRNIYLVSWSDIDGGWIIFGPGHDHLHEAPTYWAELPPSPAWAETTPHADEPGRLASVEGGGVQAGGGSEVSPPADHYLTAGMRHAAEADDRVGNHLQATYLRQGAHEIDRLRGGNKEARAHAICLSQMVEMLLNEVDRDTLARMRRAAYPESGE